MIKNIVIIITGHDVFVNILIEELKLNHLCIHPLFLFQKIIFKKNNRYIKLGLFYALHKQWRCGMHNVKCRVMYRCEK